MNLKNKIAEYDQSVANLKTQVAEAEKANTQDDVRILTKRLHDVATARYAIKSLYIETISETFNISLEDLIAKVDSHIDISKIADDYNVFVTAESKT